MVNWWKLQRSTGGFSAGFAGDDLHPHFFMLLCGDDSQIQKRVVEMIQDHALNSGSAHLFLETWLDFHGLALLESVLVKIVCPISKDKNCKNVANSKYYAVQKF